MEGFDYAWGYTSSLPAAIKKAGGSFVVRYVGVTSKCLTASEATGLHKAGLAIGLVYETTGLTFKGGHAAGSKDGAVALAAAKKLGVPAGTPIFFAIDTDTSDTATIKAYLAGCAAGSGEYPARLYGGYKVIQAAGGSGHWQTYAWSAGKISAHAGLYQYKNGVTVGGASMDKCRTLSAAVGPVNGWLGYPVVPPVPAPTSNPVVALVKDALSKKGNASPAGIKAVAYVKKQTSSGSSAWKDLCASLVRNAEGISADAWGSNKRVAANVWTTCPDKYRHTFYTAPAGTAVVWTGGSTGAGHVVVADGTGGGWSNDFGPNGYIGDGKVRHLPDLAAISKHDSALKMQGWVELFLGHRIYAAPSGSVAAPKAVPAPTPAVVVQAPVAPAQPVVEAPKAPAPVAPAPAPATPAQVGITLAAIQSQLDSLQAALNALKAQNPTG